MSKINLKSLVNDSLRTTGPYDTAVWLLAQLLVQDGDLLARLKPQVLVTPRQLALPLPREEPDVALRVFRAARIGCALSSARRMSWPTLPCRSCRRLPAAFPLPPAFAFCRRAGWPWGIAHVALPVIATHPNVASHAAPVAGIGRRPSHTTLAAR